MKHLDFMSMFFMFIFTVMHISILRLLSDFYGIILCSFLIVLDIIIGNYLFDYIDSYKKTQILFYSLIAQMIASIAGLYFMKLIFWNYIIVIFLYMIIISEVYPMIKDRSVWQRKHEEYIKKNHK